MFKDYSDYHSAISILPEAALVSTLRQMPQETRAKLLDDYIDGEMPRQSACCTRCDKALWLIMDRNLTCYCGRTSKITWISGSSGRSANTTMCDEVIVQTIKKQAELQGQQQAPSEEVEPIVQPEPSRSRTL